MRKSLTALTAATTIAVAAVATPTTADAAGAGGARRSAVSPQARSSEVRSHGPITRIRITDMVTGMGPITATVIPRTTATTHRGLITATTHGGLTTHGGVINGCWRWR